MSHTFKTSPADTPREAAEKCSMGGLFELLNGPWTLQVLWLLARNGPMRFGELRRNIDGISSRLLTVRLKTLEQKGFILRSSKQTKAPEVTYSPTGRLMEMQSIMEVLNALSQKWANEDAAAKPYAPSSVVKLDAGALAVMSNCAFPFERNR
jgi:DNA-binding HxlR family transcriptional regulator